MSKSNKGNFFEDFSLGQVLRHAAPRTLTDGDAALYIGLTGSRYALFSSDAFAQDLGLRQAPVDPLLIFHTVFGKTVADISLNAVANLGYAEGRFLAPVHAGDTLIVDNGEMKMRILSKTADTVECEVLTDGTLGSRRHINLPGVHVSLPALTEKDKEDIQLGLEVGVDYIALSFVRESQDIELLRAFLKQHPSAHQPQIVAKIEHQFAVNRHVLLTMW
jgi:acyl dehydratase